MEADLEFRSLTLMAIELKADKVVMIDVADNGEEF